MASSSRYPTAFSPVQVGTMHLDHRLVVPPHSGGGGSLLGGQAEFERHCRYWLARIEGGAQWVGGGPTFVRNPLPPGFEPTGVGAHGPGLFRHPAFVERLGRFLDQVHAAGGFASVQMVLQGGMPLAPSNTLSGYADHRIPHALDVDEIEWLVREYGESAALAAAAGADAVELHANHDDLLQWFLSPLTNRRDDGYGGDREGRRRFLREIVESIRAHVDRPLTLGLRLCLDEMVDGGYGLDTCVDLVRAFTEDGTVDYFSLDVGNNWGAPSYIPPSSYEEGAWAELCAQPKAVTHLPVVYVGRVTTPERAEQILAAGHADLVGMARAHIADPASVGKARAERAATIRPCIGTNECIHRRVVENLPFACSVNTEAGREDKVPAPPVERPRSLLVIGGGPAGTELAVRAAERGHRVTLWERETSLGGQLAAAARARANRDFARWIAWQADRLVAAGVDVVLGKEASADEVLACGPEIVAVATGARPRLPDIPGVDLPHVVGGAAALSGAPLGRRVVIVAEDDRPAPLSIADHLAANGHDVTLVFRTPAPAPLVGKYSLGAILAGLDALGVELVPSTRVVAIEPGALHVAHSFSGRRWSLEGFDSVVLATGAVPEDGLYHALRGRHAEVHLLGDAYAPRRMVFATRQAWELARALA